MLAMKAEVSGAATKLVDTVSRTVADDIFSCALKRQTGVTLRHMMDFGSNPVERQLKISAQFLRAELPIRYTGALNPACQRYVSIMIISCSCIHCFVFQKERR